MTTLRPPRVLLILVALSVLCTLSLGCSSSVEHEYTIEQTRHWLPDLLIGIGISSSFLGSAVGAGLARLKFSPPRLNVYIRAKRKFWVSTLVSIPVFFLLIVAHARLLFPSELGGLSTAEAVSVTMRSGFSYSALLFGILLFMAVTLLAARLWPGSHCRRLFAEIIRPSKNASNYSQ
jgi:hypothetical protein